MQIFIAVILLIVVALLLLVIFGFIFFVVDLFFELPYVAAGNKSVSTIIKLANIKRRETVVDLGSGDGRLLFAAAQKGARAIGYEINPFLVWFTRTKVRIQSHLRGGRTGLLGGGEVIVKKQSFWDADLKVADVIFVYAFRRTMKKFEDFIYKNAKKGTRIIVNTNPFPNKKPLKSKNGIFLYKVK